MAYILFEGIMFSGSFASIYYNKTKGGDKILQGLVTANEFIARDESMHVQFGILLYSKLEEKLTQKEIHNMFKKAVDIEKEFINESLPCNLIGMNAKSMSEYIEYLADFYLKYGSHIFRIKN
jgi:ribonucleotide reductase beta subunit family protein with ferritin-like domain